jgi:hypothetical protein
MLAQSVPYGRWDGWNRRLNQADSPVMKIHWLRDGDWRPADRGNPSAVALSPPREGRDIMPLRHHAQATRLGYLAW